MLYGSVQDGLTVVNGEKRTDQYISSANNNGAGYSNKKSDHNSWWNSQSSSSRFSSPSCKNDSKGYIKNGGRPLLNVERGKL